ncbi:MAG: hypothetical protein IT167_17005 [Bryobacterales bacterium]|nr:hypothetical protein [Bryobacterales bacterium]
MSGYEPLVIVSGLDANRVSLLRHSDAGFDSAWNGQRAAEFERLLPFTVVIRNESDLDVIAYTLLWDCTSPDGTVVVTPRAVYNFIPVGRTLPAGRKQPVFIHPAVESGAWSEEMGGLVDYYAAYFSSKETIHISLDTVLFADGSVAGPNTSHWVERWRASLEAEQHVFRAAVDASDDQLRSVLEAISKPAHEIFRAGNPSQGSLPGLGLFDVMVARSKDPAEFLPLAKGHCAQMILLEVEDVGASTVRRNLRAVLESKRYPRVKE